MELQKGQKVKLTDLNASGPVHIRVAVQISGGEADVSCFGVDGAGKLSDDRYFIFYNQTASPEGAVTMQAAPNGAEFVVDTAKLPDSIQKLVVTVAADGAKMRDIGQGVITLEGSAGSAEIGRASCRERV